MRPAIGGPQPHFEYSGLLMNHDGCCSMPYEFHLNGHQRDGGTGLPADGSRHAGGIGGSAAGQQHADVHHPGPIRAEDANSGAISRNRGNPGEPVYVLLTGADFAPQSMVTITGPAGISVGALNVLNSTTISAWLAIDPSAAPSPRNIAVTTPGAATSNSIPFTLRATINASAVAGGSIYRLPVQSGWTTEQTRRSRLRPARATTWMLFWSMEHRWLQYRCFPR